MLFYVAETKSKKIKKKNLAYKKAGMGTHPQKSTRQIKAQEHML